MPHPSLPSRAGAAPPASKFLDLLLMAACLGGSTLAWLAVCVICDHGEAWDRAAYFLVVLPLLSSIAALAAWLRAQHAWRWPSALALGQVLGLGITSGSAPTLGPLALVALAVVCAPFFIAAAIATRRRRAR